MHRAGIFKSSVLVDLVNYAGVPFLVIYAISMFFYPLLAWANWEEVQLIWDRWQSLNAAALAFAASLIAFNISKFNEDRQRERDFIAAKAFLPSTLSGLMDYFLSSARIFGTFWESSGTANSILPHHPVLPPDYREVFSNCIRHADPAVGTYLSNILVRLQVHDARLRDMVSQADNGQAVDVDRHTLISYLYRLGELYAQIGQLFGFARGEEAFSARKLEWENFRNAYGIFDIDTDDIFIDEHMNLKEFTKRAIERSAD